MLKKQHRLTKEKDIKKTFSRGRNFYSPHFVIKFLEKKGGLVRLTAVVSTKVSKKATTRNRIKRVIREIVRLNLAALISGDYIITVKPSIVTLDTKDIPNLVLGVLKKNKVLDIGY